MTFTLAAGKEKEFFQVVQEEAEKDFDPLELLYPNEVPVFEKYDEFVPAGLLREAFATGVLDIPGMRARVRGWNAPRGG
jgi:ATP-dependent Lhr-like helicase